VKLIEVFTCRNCWICLIQVEERIKIKVEEKVKTCGHEGIINVEFYFFFNNIVLKVIGGTVLNGFQNKCSFCHLDQLNKDVYKLLKWAVLHAPLSFVPAPPKFKYSILPLRLLSPCIAG